MRFRKIINKLFKKYMPKRMYILCANDRFNYGDLLFPFILKECFKDTIDEFIICSTTESDMSDRGALPTKDFSCLTTLSNSYRNILVIGGGECVFCNWKDILNYVSADLYNIETSFPTKYPFTIQKDELKNLDVVLYNSVGCHQLNEREELFGNPQNKKILESADYVAVRDTPTSLGMSRMNIMHYKCADSAILISQLFNNYFLDERVSDTVRLIQRRRYIFFQMGLVHIKGRAKEYADILKKINKEKGLLICLCPIGTAIGHDDQQALSEISKYLPSDIYYIVKSPSIWDIMSLISQAELYCGTSLHGAITAMSYKTPLIVHGPKKLQVYIESWYDTVGSEYSFVSMENLEKAILRRLDSRFIIFPDNQIESVKQSFSRMKKTILR